LLDNGGHSREGSRESTLLDNERERGRERGIERGKLSRDLTERGRVRERETSPSLTHSLIAHPPHQGGSSVSHVSEREEERGPTVSAKGPLTERE
jgi:hypothetical protein